MSHGPPGRLDRSLTFWRIGDPDGRFPIFDARGAMLFPGRWNDAENPVIYCAEHYSTAMLEILAHSQRRFPPNQHALRALAPPGVSYEVVTKDALPEWASPNAVVSAAFGARWAAQKRSLLLLVPSVVARMENNVIVNPAHPEFARIETALPQPVWWDKRLFSP
jgi:RES domain-containing protein